jgi:carbon-monoxide dehydrogenase large subunit
VKWRADRIDEFLGAVHGRDVVSRAELALDANGKALALRVKGYANVGAYGTATGIAIQLLIGPWVSTSIYDIPVIDEQFTRRADATPRPPAPTAAPAGPRPSTSPSG